MHQQEQHKPAKDTHVHEPAKKVLSEYLNLQNHIKEKGLKKCRYFFAEQGSDNPFESGEKSP